MTGLASGEGSGYTRVMIILLSIFMSVSTFCSAEGGSKALSVPISNAIEADNAGGSAGGAGVRQGSADNDPRPRRNAANGANDPAGVPAAYTSSFSRPESCVVVGNQCEPKASVCSSDRIETFTNGVDRSRSPRGCAAPIGSDECLNVANHRAILPEEWSGPSQIHTVLGGGDFPPGQYGLFLSYGPKVLRVGTVTLRKCAACSWMIIGSNGDAGNGLPPSAPCTETGKGRISAGNLATSTWLCSCK